MQKFRIVAEKIMNFRHDLISTEFSLRITISQALEKLTKKLKMLEDELNAIISEAELENNKEVSKDE